MSARVTTTAAALTLFLGAGCQTTQVRPSQSPEALAEADEAAEDGVTSVKAARHFQDSVAYLKDNKNSDARRHLELAFKADPTFAVAKYNLAVLTEKEGKYDEAVSLYRGAFEADPTLDLAVENLGVILEASGQSDAARRLYEEAITRNPEAVYPRIRLARLSHRDGDASRAVTLAREALQYDATSVDAYRVLAHLYAENKKNQLARLIAVRGQKLAPDDPHLIYALALVAQNEKDVAGARRLLNKVIAADPAHVEARITLARMALEVRDWKTAEPQLRALIEKEPANGGLHTNLGLTLKGQGRFEDAAQAYTKGVELGSSAAALNLAILEIRNLSKPDEGEKHIEKYLSLGGDGSTARPFLEEARTLSQAKLEEERMMALMKEQEEEARRLAEAEAKRAVTAGKTGLDTRPQPEEAMEEEPPEVAPLPPPEQQRRAPPRKKQPKAKSKSTAPAADDGFFD
jgi:Tfp pilus assembly protein PilF